MKEDTHKIHDIEQQKDKGCSVVTYQSATVCVPVTVSPKVNTGEITVSCCDEPIITPFPCTLCCQQKENGHCFYTVLQNICIEVPIELSAMFAS